MENFQNEIKKRIKRKQTFSIGIWWKILANILKNYEYYFYLRFICNNICSPVSG